MLNPPVLYLWWLLHASTGTSEILIFRHSRKAQHADLQTIVGTIQGGSASCVQHVLALHSPALEQVGN